MNNIPELIELLRWGKQANMSIVTVGGVQHYVNSLKAADGLESQEAEIEMRIAGGNEVVMKLQARVKELEAELKEAENNLNYYRNE